MGHFRPIIRHELIMDLCDIDTLSKLVCSDLGRLKLLLDVLHALCRMRFDNRLSLFNLESSLFDLKLNFLVISLINLVSYRNMISINFQRHGNNRPLRRHCSGFTFAR